VLFRSQNFRDRIANQLILPEEQREIENQIEFVRHAVRAFAREYDKAEYKVLWPEVSGCVAIPGTEHHCHFVHRLLHPDTALQGCNDPKCYQPHYLRFRTDGIIELYHKVWLLEQKTTSRADNMFWEKFQLDFQTWGYVYGIWKVTGLKPSGFLVNAIIKHSRKPYGSPSKGYKMELDPTNVDFMREPYLISDEDLQDWERDFKGLANDYEEAFRDKALNPDSLRIYKNTNSCHTYNRRCYYFDLCKRKQEQIDGEFTIRNRDYVDDEYYNLLGLPKPESEQLCQIQTTSSKPVMSVETSLNQES
jgi:hypothetical protein